MPQGERNSVGHASAISSRGSVTIYRAGALAVDNDGRRGARPAVRSARQTTTVRACPARIRPWAELPIGSETPAASSRRPDVTDEPQRRGGVGEKSFCRHLRCMSATASLTGSCASSRSRSAWGPCLDIVTMPAESRHQLDEDHDEKELRAHRAAMPSTCEPLPAAAVARRHSDFGLGADERAPHRGSHAPRQPAGPKLSLRQGLHSHGSPARILDVGSPNIARTISVGGVALKVSPRPHCRSSRLEDMPETRAQPTINNPGHR
jgi:hypothetical protein